MDDYKELNEILVRLFRSIMDVEEKAIITREFQDITNNDMHVIEAIGIGTPKICPRSRKSSPSRWEP